MNFTKLNIPPELIAKEPLKERDLCKLLCLYKGSGKIEHRVFRDVTALIGAKDLLVFNDTRVINARFFGNKHSGGNVELLLLKELNAKTWQVLIKGKNIRQGTQISFDDFSIEVLSAEQGLYTIKIFSDADIKELMSKKGLIPLPPYIDRKPEENDYEMYQTVFAKNNGSVAAPTASLHFTNALIDQIRCKGADIQFVTLHVGYGTFSPIRDITTFVIHEEDYSVQWSLQEAVRSCKKRNGKVWAVGTTVVRTLETVFNKELELLNRAGSTSLFIKDPYDFKVVDCMITNFHHPSTSLMYLVSAFAGSNNIVTAYNEAVNERYRMLSYGDAMAIMC